MQFVSFDINQASLPTPFYCALGIYFCLYGPFNSISIYEFSRQLSAISLCSPGLISALLVLSTTYLLEVTWSVVRATCCHMVLVFAVTYSYIYSLERTHVTVTLYLERTHVTVTFCLEKTHVTVTFGEDTCHCDILFGDDTCHCDILFGEDTRHCSIVFGEDRTAQ